MRKFRQLFSKLCLVILISCPIGILIFYSQGIKADTIVIQDMIKDLYDSQAALYTIQNYIFQEMKNNIETVKADMIKQRGELVKGLTNVENMMNTKFQRPEYSELKSYTVMIISEERANPKYKSIGTGVVIKETNTHTIIVTNKHVCEDTISNRCYIVDPETRSKYKIMIVKRHSIYDIQIVKVQGVMPNKSPIKGIKNVSPSNPVYVVGHYLGNLFFYSEGVVAGFSRISGDLVVTAPIGPGNSGSGVMTKDGYLAGLVYSTSVVGTFPNRTIDLTHGTCVNAKVLRLFLSGYIT